MGTTGVGACAVWQLCGLRSHVQRRNVCRRGARSGEQRGNGVVTMAAPAATAVLGDVGVCKSKTRPRGLGRVKDCDHSEGLLHWTANAAAGAAPAHSWPLLPKLRAQHAKNTYLTLPLPAHTCSHRRTSCAWTTLHA